MLSTGITEGELFDAGLSSGIVLAAATCDGACGFVRGIAAAVADTRRPCFGGSPFRACRLAFLVLSFRCRWVVDGFVSGKGWLFIPPGWAGKPGSGARGDGNPRRKSL